MPPASRGFNPSGTFDGDQIVIRCAAICGVPQAVALARTFGSYIGIGGAAAEGGAAATGFWAPTVLGTEVGGATIAGIAAFALAAIAWAIHDIGSAWGGPTQPPSTTPGGCGGATYDPSENITGWAVPITYPGCAGAWDHSQDNAQEVCDAHLTCTGRCANGQPCKPVAILIDRVDETRYGVTCRAEGRDTCQCGCQ